MKKLLLSLFGACLMATMAQAQVMTVSTTANNYHKLISDDSGELAYNADFAGDTLKAMYVYVKSSGRRGSVTLQPKMMHTYDYDGQGMLTSRTTYYGVNDGWVPTRRLDYTLQPDSYSIEYSCWNVYRARFDAPTDRMTYSLVADDQVNYVSCYHRSRGRQPYQLEFQVEVRELPLYMDEFVTQIAE